MRSRNANTTSEPESRPSAGSRSTSEFAWQRTVPRKQCHAATKPLSAARITQSGELGGIDRRLRQLTGEHSHDLMRGELSHSANSLLGVVGRVRRDDRVVEPEQRVLRAPVAMLCRFLLNVVEPSSCDPVLAKRSVQSFVADYWSTRGVDEDGRGLHPAQFRFAD